MREEQLLNGKACTPQRSCGCWVSPSCSRYGPKETVWALDKPRPEQFPEGNCILWSIEHKWGAQNRKEKALYTDLDCLSTHCLPEGSECTLQSNKAGRRGLWSELMKLSLVFSLGKFLSSLFANIQINNQIFMLLAVNEFVLTLREVYLLAPFLTC